MIMTPDHRVVYMDFPGRMHSFVVTSANDFYTIVINSRISYAQQLEAYLHELAHITAGDFEKQSPADLIEIYAHKAEGL